MFRFLADENFNGKILRVLQRKLPDLDVLRVQDTELYSADDPTVLDWAAREKRVVLSHDVATLVGFAYDRLELGEPMPGVVAVRTDRPLGVVIEDLLILIEASEPEELDQRILFVPL